MHQSHRAMRLSPMAFDFVIKNALYFDGTGAPAKRCHIAIKEGRIAQVSSLPLIDRGAKVIDADGLWAMPGFIDAHTHYDAELLIDPSLSESVRHGVTTIVGGSCSLSLICADHPAGAELFVRSVSLPHPQITNALTALKTWSGPTEYVQHLKTLALGPNVASFLGHSDLRLAVMGNVRAHDPQVTPTAAEMQKMRQILIEALDSGLLGLSSTASPSRAQKASSFRVPSSVAGWLEYRQLNRVLREHGGVHQGSPQSFSLVNALGFLFASLGIFRKALKITVIGQLAQRSQHGLQTAIHALALMSNRFLNANFRWQALPGTYALYADGFDRPILAALSAHSTKSTPPFPPFSATNVADRTHTPLTKTQANHHEFWQQQLDLARVVHAPDSTVVGKSFGEMAAVRGISSFACFAELTQLHGDKLRWRTPEHADSPRQLQLLSHNDNTLLSFSDAGAWVRNKARYNFPLKILRLVRDAHLAKQPSISIEMAVWRLTGELAAWFNIDAGRIQVGDRADLILVNPKFLDASLDTYAESPMPGTPDVNRVVNRNDATVPLVMIQGRIAWSDNSFAQDFGSASTYGQFLPALRPAANPPAETLH